MKLVPVKKRKIAILFTSGLGDTMLFVPLLKELKRKHFTITCIFYSKFDNDCLFDSGLVDSKIFIQNKLSLFLYAITRPRHYINIYINQFGNGILINLFANICSRKITKTQSTIGKYVFQKRIKSIVSDFTDAEQNMHLLYSTSNSPIKNIDAFYLHQPIIENCNKFRTQQISLNRFFIIQISAGNNKTPYKNWPISKWQVLIKKLCTTFKRLEFIIVGDNTEVQYIKQFEDLNCENCSILIGKTTIKELFNLIGHCQGYIGLDSGLMHIAVALKKKTFTIFGASNEKNYGYEFIDPEHHQVITSNVICRPCSSWKNANTSRITNPLHCPDYACLSSIDANQVFNQVCYHFNLSSIFEK